MFKNQFSHISFGFISFRMKKIFQILLGLNVAFFALYAFFMGNTIYNVVHKKALEVSLQNTRSVVAQLENSLLHQYGEIDSVLLESRGFSRNLQTHYISSESSSLVLR